MRSNRFPGTSFKISPPPTKNEVKEDDWCDEGILFRNIVTDLIWHNTGKGNDIDSDDDDGNDDYDGLHKFLTLLFTLCRKYFISNLLLTYKSGVNFQLKLAFYVFIECMLFII
jgi:hypothetical protein